MLWALFIVLLVIWILGLVASFTAGGLIHLLLITALAVLIIQLTTGNHAT